MIVYKNWTITASETVIARQYDNLSRRLEVIGDLPEGWEWAILVKAGSAMDIIPLSPMEGGVGAVLTADQLSISGYYQMQLRGTRGEEVRHTNVITTLIPASLSGSGQWPTEPSEFVLYEQRMRGIASHPPIPGGSGYWMIWDPDGGEYVESSFPMSDTAPKWVTFEVDPATGALYQMAVVEDSQTKFSVDEDGYLEVSIGE